MVKEVPKHVGCGGEIIREHGAYKCLECGKEWVTLKEIHQFFEDNKEGILGDYRRLGFTVARKKWFIPSGTWTAVVRRWGLGRIKERALLNSHNSPAALPELPAFSDTWPEKVQIKWLDIWLYLATK